MEGTSSKTVYIDEEVGQDEPAADGSGQSPYKSLAYAYIQHHSESKSTDYLMRKDEPEAAGEEDGSEPRREWKPPSKSATKKATSILQGHLKKLAKQDEVALRQKQEAEQRQMSLQEAQKIKITENPALPLAMKIRLNEKDPKLVKLRSGDHKEEVDYSDGRGSRVRVTGRVQQFRTQKDVSFITLTDGYGKLQCVFTGELIETYDVRTMTRGTAMEVYGEMREVLPGQTAPDGRELHVDYYTIIGKAVGDKEAISTRVAHDADPQTLLDNRHLTLRGDTVSSVMKVRAALLRAFRRTYEGITPSCLEVVSTFLFVFFPFCAFTIVSKHVSEAGKAFQG